jgi:hypothetical protein
MLGWVIFSPKKDEKILKRVISLAIEYRFVSWEPMELLDMSIGDDIVMFAFWCTCYSNKILSILSVLLLSRCGGQSSTLFRASALLMAASLCLFSLHCKFQSTAISFFLTFHICPWMLSIFTSTQFTSHFLDARFLSF